MQPRQIRETVRPVLPSRRYSIGVSTKGIIYLCQLLLPVTLCTVEGNDASAIPLHPPCRFCFCRNRGSVSVALPPAAAPPGNMPPGGARNTSWLTSSRLSNGEVSCHTKASPRIRYSPGAAPRVSQSKESRYRRSPADFPQV